MYKKTGNFSKKSIFKKLLDQTLIEQSQRTHERRSYTYEEPRPQEEFITAITNGDIEAVKSILSSQAGNLPYEVMSAIFESRNQELMEILLLSLLPKQELNIDSKYIKELIKLLQHAAKEGNQEILSRILNNITIEPNEEQTDDILKHAIIEKDGIYRLSPDAQYITPDIVPPVEKWRRESVEFLNVYKPNPSETALSIAVRNRNVESVEKLLISGANVNIKNKHDDTLLHILTEEGNGNLKIAEQIIKHIEYLNQQNERLKTSLHLAVKNRYLEIANPVIKLIEYVNQQNKYFETPLHLAVRNRYLEIVRQLLACGADVNLQDENGRTALHYTAIIGDIEIARLLMKGKPKPNPTLRDRDGNTSLHEAVRSGNVELVELLIRELEERGEENIDLQNGDGDTPLHIAIRDRNMEVIRPLIEHGANLTIRNKRGETPEDMIKREKEYALNTEIREKYKQLLDFISRCKKQRSTRQEQELRRASSEMSSALQQQGRGFTTTRPRP